MAENRQTDDDSNDDFERFLHEARRFGFSVGLVTKANEEIQHRRDEEYFNNRLMQERKEMTDKAKWVGVLLVVLTSLVTMTMWATKASQAAEEARVEIRQVETRTNEKIGEAIGTAKTANELAHANVAVDGKQQAEIDALKEDIKEIKETQAKTLEAILRMERRDR